MAAKKKTKSKKQKAKNKNKRNKQTKQNKQKKRSKLQAFLFAPTTSLSVLKANNRVKKQVKPVVLVWSIYNLKKKNWLKLLFLQLATVTELNKLSCKQNSYPFCGEQN